MKKIVLAIIILGVIFFGKNVLAQDMSINSDDFQCSCSCACEYNLDNLTLGGEDKIFEGMIVISEFVSDPVSGGTEWVEVYNTTERSVNLENFYLTEGSGRKFMLTGHLDSFDYKMFEVSSLNNSGDIINLMYEEILIDKVSYGDFDDGDLTDNALSAVDPYSVVRKAINQERNNDFEDFVVTTIVTPGMENIIEEIIEDQDEVLEENQEIIDEKIEEINWTIKLNEIFPDPAGSDVAKEWIELFNFGSEALDLSGLYLDDIDGGSAPYLISNVIIGPGEYHIFSNDITRVTLNNTSDEVRLLDGEIIIDQCSYEEVEENNSFSLFGQEWVWTNSITPDEENILNTEDDFEVAMVRDEDKKQESDEPITNEYSRVEIAEIKNIEKGKKIEFEGKIIELPNIFGKQIMYLDGIQLYSSKALWPDDLTEGQVVKIQGRVSESKGEKRVLLDDFSLLDQETEIVPEQLQLENVNENFVAKLVKISGELVDKSGSKLTLADEFGEFFVVLKPNTGLAGKMYEVGDSLSVVGVLIKSETEFQILPRSENDLIVEEVMADELIGLAVPLSMVATIGENENWQKYLLTGILFLLLIVGVVIWKRNVIMGFIRLNFGHLVQFFKTKIKSS